MGELMDKKFIELQEIEKQNSDQLHGLSRFTLTLNAENTLKKVIEIPLLVKYDWSLNWNVPSGTQIDRYTFEILFQGYPDWIIPMIKLIPQFYTADPYTLMDSNVNFSECDFNYFWTKIDSLNYKLYLYIYADVEREGHSIPLYVDLSAWIVNDNVRISEQHQLG